MSREVHNRKFKNDIRQHMGKGEAIKKSQHKAFVEELKKQALSDESSTTSDDINPSDNDIYIDEVAKKLEAKSNELFAQFDDD